MSDSSVPGWGFSDSCIDRPDGSSIHYFSPGLTVCKCGKRTSDDFSKPKPDLRLIDGGDEDAA